MNEAKARFVKWAMVRGRLHDSLTLCNWMWPMAVSPLKERKYRGDTALKAKFFSAVTGVAKTEAELDKDAERVVTLLRALTVRSMGTVDMRNQHDNTNEWITKADKGKPQFTPGTIQMEKSDLELGRTMVYRLFGWDEKTGAPTKATLEALGMSDIAMGLAEKLLLPV